MPKKQTRNNKTKSSSQITKPMASEEGSESDDGFGSIAILMNSGKSSRASTQSNKSVEEAPPPPVPEWEQVGTTKEEYEALCEKVKKQMIDSQLESIKQIMIAELDSISYWQSRIEKLQKMREPYNKRQGWSAEVLEEVEQIDANIQDCENEIDRIQQECNKEECDEEEEEYERCCGCGRWEPVGQMDHAAGYGTYCSRDCGPSGYARDYGWS